MKPSALFISLLVLCNLPLAAQNQQDYQPFRNGYTYQYLNYAPYQTWIRTIHVDSARLKGADSIFYLNPLLNTGSPMVQEFGVEMVKKTDGTFLFITYLAYDDPDTLVLKAAATLGQQWTCTLNGKMYTATYKSKTKEPVLTNRLDSVKTFLFERADGFTDSIKLSKQYGLTYGWNFGTPEWWFRKRQDQLQYIYNTNEGVNRLSMMTYFDFEPGDLFIYRPWLEGPPSQYIDNDLLHVLDKRTSNNGDTLVYRITKTHITGVTNGVYSSTQSMYTVYVTRDSVTSAPAGLYPYRALLCTPAWSTVVRSNYAVELDTITGAMQSRTPFVPFEYSEENDFFPGLGLTRYDYDYAPNDGNYYYIQSEHRKGTGTDETLNLSLLLATDPAQAQSPLLALGPNPFQDELTMRSALPEGAYTIRLYSATGALVYSQDAILSPAQQTTLSDLSSIAPGLYTLLIEGAAGTFRYKAVKQ